MRRKQGLFVLTVVVALEAAMPSSAAAAVASASSSSERVSYASRAVWNAIGPATSRSAPRTGHPALAADQASTSREELVGGFLATV